MIEVHDPYAALRDARLPVPAFRRRAGEYRHRDAGRRRGLGAVRTDRVGGNPRSDRTGAVPAGLAADAARRSRRGPVQPQRAGAAGAAHGHGGLGWPGRALPSAGADSAGFHVPGAVRGRARVQQPGPDRAIAPGGADRAPGQCRHLEQQRLAGGQCRRAGPRRLGRLAHRGGGSGLRSGRPVLAELHPAAHADQA